MSLLPIRQQLLIDGTWTTVTGDTEGSPAIKIKRGYSGEQTNLSAAQCNFTLLNPDGAFSNRNPMSAYYRKLGRNTQYRVATVEDDVSLRLGDYSDLDDGSYDGARVWTADKAVLDITGDIDIRIDCEPDQWYGGESFHLASKYDTELGNDRSWTFVMDDTGRLVLLWSTDGTVAGWQYAYSDDFVPDGGRLALRATLDVDNGSGGRTVKFYTADTIAGPWTQLGGDRTSTGTTSIHSGAAELEIGTAGGGARYAIATWRPFCGRIYAFELYNGIAGTRVANMDATAQAAGTTSWSDGLGTPNTWTLAASATLDDADYRFWGEVPKFPQEGDKTGRYVTSAVLAADLIQRLGQGSKALSSPIYRNLSRVNAIGWWPMEDESDAEQSSAVVGKPGYISDAQFGADDTLPGSAGALAFSADTGYASGIADPKITTSTGTAYMLWYFKMPLPGSQVTPLNFYMENSATYRIDFQVSATLYTLTFRNQAGTALDTSNAGFGAGAEPGQWIAMRVLMNQNGSNIDWEWAWYPVGGADAYGVSNSYAGTVGRPRSWISYPYTGKSDLSIAHVLLAQEDVDFNSDAFKDSTNAYVGEPADERFSRLCRDYGIQYWIVGRQVNNASESIAEPMGAQRPLPLLTLLTECAEVANGFLYGPRDKFGLALRLPHSFINREPVELDYSAGVFSEQIKPTDDDLPIRNDVTVSRPGGGFGRSVQTSGPLNINDPTTDPDGVGVYDTFLTRVAQLDSRLPALAAFEKLLGTTDEYRWPKVPVSLAGLAFVNDAALTAQVRRLDLGDPIALTNLPIWIQPDTAEVIIRGYLETLVNFEQNFQFSTAPYSPYRLNDLTESDRSKQRAGATNTATANALDSDDTTIIIHTPTGAMWRRSAGAPTGTYPLEVTIGGEVISVPSCTNVTLAFVATGTVSHNSNDPVTPSLPAGLASGDLMLMFVAVRSTTAAPVKPSGWQTMTSLANVALFGKIAGGSESAPTVTFTGTIAGDDTSGQMVAFRPSSPLSTAADLATFMVDATWLTNASAQDIAYPGAGVRWPDNGLVLYLGWKQDDWTSVASPGTEIGEPDTTTGFDQGIVWAYTIQTTKTQIAPASFTVTGGASAVSKGALVVIHPRHQLWSGVTRSVNGVVKSQDDEEVVQVVDYFRAGL